jgi:hypothetical protein
MYSLRKMGIKHISSSGEGTVAMVDHTRRRSFTLPLVVLLGGCSAIDGGGPPTASGRVDHKYITASTTPPDEYGGESVELVYVDSDRNIRTYEGKYDDRLEESNAAVGVSPSLHSKFVEEYATVHYYVSVELSSRDPVNDADSGGMAYRTDRSIFNDARIGDSLTYEIGEDGDRMTAVVDSD